MIEAVSLDSTVSPTWAVTHDYRLEKDALAEHQAPESLETPDLPEPELPTPRQQPNTEKSRFKLGPDGSESIRSAKTLHARPTYKSATSSEPAHIVLGYDVHLGTAVRSATWTGDLTRVAFGPAPPPFITAICVLRPAPPTPDPSEWASSNSPDVSPPDSEKSLLIVATPPNEKSSSGLSTH